MKLITSRANPVFKRILATVRAGARQGSDAWLEGVHLCEAWLEHRGQPHVAVFDQSSQDDPQVISLASRVDRERQLWLSRDLISAVSTLKSPSPVGFVVPIVQREIALVLQQVCVALDGVQDPGNVGTILRTAAAAGVKQFVAGLGCAALWSPKVLRSGQGAHFAMSLYEGIDLRKWFLQLGDTTERSPIVATSLTDAQPLFGSQLPAHCIWVFGNEGQGVSPELLELVDHRVRIDHDRQAVESLNVASAAAICLFEQRRQQTIHSS